MVLARDAVRNDGVAAVFRGMVTHVDAGKAGQIVTFEVSRVWKGAVPRIVRVYYFQESAVVFIPPLETRGLGIRFQNGTEYVVLARIMTLAERPPFRLSDSAASFASGTCGAYNTLSVDAAEKSGEIRLLGPGWAPE